MVMWLKQSTAADVVIGAFIDDTDGKTAETALTLSQADCILIKNGGAAAQKNDATSATHLSSGHYKVPLNTTDTNTLGRLRLLIHESGALPVWRDFMVVPANVYDSVVAGSDKLDVDAYQVTAGAITGAAIATDAIDADALADGAITSGVFASGALTAAAIAADALTAAKFAADVTTELQSGLATAAALATVNAYVDELESRLTAARAGYLDNLSGGAVALASSITTLIGYVDTEVAAIKAKTDNLPASPAAVGSAMTLADGSITAAKIATGAIDADALAADAVDEILDEIIEGTITVRQALRGLLAVALGLASGGGGSTVNFRDLADTKNRVSATVDEDGNRTAVTLDLS